MLRPLAYRFGLVVMMLTIGASIAFAQSEEKSPASRQVGDENALSEYTMGVFLLESGRPQKAVPHLENAWRASDKDEQIGNKLCEAYFRAGDLKSCDGVIDELLEQNEENEVALLFRARISYFRGDEEKALEYLERLRSFSEPSFEVERLVARIQLELGRYEEALASYQNAIRIDPNYPIMHYRFGILLRRFDRKPEAEEAFRKAVELQPLFSEAVIELAEIFIEDERHDEAEAVLHRLLEEDGEFYDALMMAANLYADRGSFAEAIKLLEDRKQSGDLPREAVLLLARLYYETDDFDSSLSLFKGMFEDDTRTPELARVLGELSLRAGKADSALIYYRSAIEMEPDDYRNYVALFFASSARFSRDGAPLIELSDDAKLDLLDHAAGNVEADDFDGLYVVGMSYQSLDDFKQARRFFAQAHELRPDD